MRPLKLLVTLALLCAVFAGAASLAVMSIDLGNEFMKIGLVKPGVPMETVLNTESSRKSNTIVAMRKADDREFAAAALNTATRFPSSAYIFLRELLAKNVDNPIVKQFQERFPYYKMEDDAERAAINFVHPDGSKYSVEELLAMIMESAKRYASDFAEQKVTDAVIICPAHFNQAERRALKRSAEMAGIKVLQLMNSHAAVALNYGVFRRKEFNSTAQNYMFFDMGSTSTTAVIVSYQMVKMKMGSIMETNPQLTVRGLGLDRTLGALEMTLRLRNHLAKVFNEQKKTKNNVLENPRSMAKLHKEAERVKKILSANSATYAQVENLMDEQDFKAKVTREEFEEMCADIFGKVAATVEQAIKNSDMTMGEISEVILMGGGTRVPKVKEMLQKAIGREELGMSINTDEAAALGAVYQAAYLSTGFRVKTFAVKDANMYPIQVEFERSRVAEDGTEATKLVKRTLFTKLNPYPQKKVMTFNKHHDDFSFNVNYGDMSFMSASQLDMFGSLNLSSVALEGVKEQVEKQTDNFTESKGVKAHFRLDESGLLQLDEVEVLFERMPNPAAEESTFSKLSNTISSFFGSGSEADKEGKVDVDKGSPAEAPTEGEAPSAPEDDVPPPTEEKPKSGSESKAKDSDAKPKTEKKEKKAKKSSDSAKEKPTDKDGKAKADKKPEASGNGTAANATVAEPAKPVTVRRPVASKVKILDGAQPDSEHIKASRELLLELTRKDEEKMRLAAVKNELESFSYDVKSKLYEEEYEACSTEKERTEIREKITGIIDWYDEQQLTTPLKEFEDKLAEAKKLVKVLYKRVAEYKERPRAMEALKSTLNHTLYIMKSMRNYSLSAPDGDGPFTDVELTTLETLHADTKKWMKTKKGEQKSRKPTQEAAFTVEDVATKISALDREVKYLLNKAKAWVPKKPKVTILDGNTTKSSNNSSNSTDSNNSTAGADADATNSKEAKQENTIEKPDDKAAGESQSAEETPETPEAKPSVEPVKKEEEEPLQLDSGAQKPEGDHEEL